MAKSTSYAVGFVGQGAIKALTVDSLLNDWLGFGPKDSDGYYESSDNDIEIFLPVSTETWNDEIAKVYDWTARADMPYTAILRKGEHDDALEDAVEDAESTREAVNVNKALVDAVANADADEKVIVVLWGDEGDENSEAVATLAEVKGLQIKDITAGLDDLKFADDDEVEEEPEPEPAPAKEEKPRRRRGAAASDDEEKPARGSRRRGREQSLDDEEKPLVEEEDEKQPEPVKEEKPSRSRRSKAKEKDSADTNPNPDGDFGTKETGKSSGPVVQATFKVPGEIIEALQGAQKYLRLVEEARALLAGVDDTPSALRLKISKALEIAAEPLAGEEPSKTTENSSEAAEEAAEPVKRGRGRPRKTPVEEVTTGYLKNAEGIYRKAGRGRPRRGETLVELTEAEVDEIRRDGLLDED